MPGLYTGAFELRRLVIRWSRGVSGGTAEDFDAITHHFVKLTGGVPDAGWTNTDYGNIEAVVDTWWGSAKTSVRPTTVLKEYRWYKDGPDWSPADRADGPPNPADRVTTRSVAGTSAVGGQLPPQVAATITKITDIRKRWGRVYLPNPDLNQVDADGRLQTTYITAQLGAMVTMYNNVRGGPYKPVVFSRGRSAYTTDGGAVIPVHGASAYEITSLQMDNIWDELRSRRYRGPTVRSVTVLT